MFSIFVQRSDIGTLVKELTDRMEKTKNERSQLQEQIDSMELELQQVQDEIGEISRQNEQVSGMKIKSVSLRSEFTNYYF